MPLTREFRETVQARLQSDRKYRKELLREGVECLLAGDLDTGKAILRDYVNATIGFDELSRRTKRPAKSLMRMLGPSGNPQARNLLEMINHLQKAEGLHFEVSLRALPATRGESSPSRRHASVAPSRRRRRENRSRLEGQPPT
jgi:hypothetical protein